MAYGTPANPVPSTVITVAYAVTNILDPIRWLRIMTGGSDPPGSNYWLRSTSISAVSWVDRATEVVAALGYTPVNKAGDSGIGALSVTSLTASGQVGSTVAAGTAPLIVTSPTLITNLNADLLDGLNAGNATGQIPISNGTMNVNCNVERLGGSTKAEIIASIPGAVVEVPAGVVAMWKTGTAPTGWTIDSAFAGRIAAGAGGSFGAVNSTGGSATHNHTVLHNHPLDMGGGTGTVHSVQLNGGANMVEDGHEHNGSAVDTTPTTSTPTALPPFLAVNYIIKS